jgi:ribosome-binding factor A
MTRRSSRGRSRASGVRRSRAAAGGTAREYPRTARLNHLVHEIVAEEIERIDDDRLGILTVVAVDVAPDLRHATVWYTSLSGAGNGTELTAGAATGAGAPAGSGSGSGGAAGEPDEELVEALAEHRPRVQAAIGRQARLKRTPELTFVPDPVTQQAQRVEAILRDIGTTE